MVIAKASTIIEFGDAAVDGILEDAGKIVNVRHSQDDRRAAVKFQREGNVKTWQVGLERPGFIENYDDLSSLVDNVDANIHVVEGYWDEDILGLTAMGNLSKITVQTAADANVWAHEIGHALGLPHRNENGVLMHEFRNFGGNTINDTEREAFE